MFRFASPWFLLLLAAIPVLVFFRRRRHDRLALHVPQVSPSEIGLKSVFVLLAELMPVLKYTALVLLVVAMARPQSGSKKVESLTEGINIVLAVDLSESMKALDFKREGEIVTRLAASKGVVHEFIMNRKGDRIALVVFGSHAYTQIPLTRDYSTIAFMLDRLEAGAAGPNTAMGDAVGISLKRIADIESKSNVIILLTDGKSNSGSLSPLDAARIAASREVKVYTIGIGKKGKAPFLVNDPVFGKRYVYRHVDIDFDTLKQIADRTGGRFFRAEDTRSLKEIYSVIDSLETTEVKVESWVDYSELYPWLLLPAFGLLLLYTVLSNTRFLRIP